MLLRALPCESDVFILSTKISITSAISYQSEMKSNKGKHNAGRPLTHPEKHPTLLARQMLLFAAAVQCLSPKEVFPGLTEHHHAIMKRLAESAIRWVNLDDAYLGTLEILENFMLEAFYLVDCGNIRRAWVTIRRAVTAAQMSGLHRPKNYRFMSITDESDLEPEAMWGSLISLERLLSLLLGLPSSTGYMNLSFSNITIDSTPTDNLSSLVGALSGKILERNQLEFESAQQAIRLTGEIDREMIEAITRMGPSFFRPLVFTGLQKDSKETLDETRRAFSHVCYYSLVIQLHLPHMLSPHDPSQRLYSKIACVNASRDILARAIDSRTFSPVSACCRMTDFMALTAGMALVLGHATSHSGNERENAVLAHQRHSDRATVEKLLSCLSSLSELQDDVLAVRFATLLTEFLAFEEDAAQRRSMRFYQPAAYQQSGDDQRQILIMRVPYLGSIQISGDGVAALSNVSAEHGHSSAESVTIGGIGSMHIAQSPVSHANGSGSTLGMPTPPVPGNFSYDAGAADLQSSSAVDASLDSHMMFLDPASSFDDWALQGVDTAFMEALMRGSAAPPVDGSGHESWDISTSL